MYLKVIAFMCCGLFVSCHHNNKKDVNGELAISDSTLHNLKVCTEYPLPDTGKTGNGKSAGSLKYQLWPINTQVLFVFFLDGDSVVQQKVMQVAKEWENYCGIRFRFNDSAGTGIQPDITISFQYPGSWSSIGKSSRFKRPSMNLGWLTAETDNAEYHSVVLHEFGHALGLIHEHKNPNTNLIKWNKPAVYAYYAKPPNTWNEQTTDHNLFEKYESGQVNGTAFDPQSIMLYAIPKEFTTDNFSVEPNIQLSENDKLWIGQLYPKK